MTTTACGAAAPAGTFDALMSLFLLRGVAVLASFLECSAEAIEPRFPQPPIISEPGLELPKRFGPKGIEAALSIRPHGDEPGFMQDPQMTGDAGLMDSSLPDDVAHLPLAVAQRRHDAAARGIGQCGEGINMHDSVYVYTCIN